MVQTCIVHLIRNSLSFVTWKDRKAILPSIKAIYHAENADVALQQLEEFEVEWGKRYPAIGQAWRRSWQHVIPFFAFARGYATTIVANFWTVITMRNRMAPARSKPFVGRRASVPKRTGRNPANCALTATSTFCALHEFSQEMLQLIG